MSQNFAFKSLEASEPPVIEQRRVKAIIGRVDVVDRENDLIVSDSFKIDKIAASRWSHNSYPLAKQLGLVSELEEPIGYGKGWVDGTNIIGEIEVMKGARGDQFIEHIRAAGDALCYSHGFSYKSEERRADGVRLLHGSWTTEMSPVPAAASPGTRTLAAMLGMKLDVNGQPLTGFVEGIIQAYISSDEFADEVRRAVRWVAFDVAYAEAADQLWDQIVTEDMKTMKAAEFRQLFLKHILKADEHREEEPPPEPELDIRTSVQNQASQVLLEVLASRFGGGN